MLEPAGSLVAIRGGLKGKREKRMNTKVLVLDIWTHSFV